MVKEEVITQMDWTTVPGSERETEKSGCFLVAEDIECCYNVLIKEWGNVKGAVSREMT